MTIRDDLSHLANYVGHNPVGVDRLGRRVPRVAEYSNPGLEDESPSGIMSKLSSTPNGVMDGNRSIADSILDLQFVNSRSSVPKRFSRLQHMLNSLLSLLLSAQRNKGLALEIQQVLLRHERLM